MLKINENGYVNAKDIYRFVEVKTRFADWIKRCIDYADLQNNKDFFSVLGKSTGGRPLTEYYFTMSSAKEVCIVSATSKAKELRRWLIEVGRQRENLELFSEDEIIKMSILKGFFKYIENQKEIYNIHKTEFCKNSTSNNPYAEFNVYRNNILNIDKHILDENLKKYCIENTKSSPKLTSNFDKIRFLNEYDSLRNAVWDFLEIKGEINSFKIAELVKRMATAEKLQFLPKNENNLFQKKEDINLKMLSE